MIALLAAGLVATNVLAATSAPALPTNATPAQIVASCRTMIPADVTLKGRLILRSRKGIVLSEYGYVLERRAGETRLSVTDTDGRPVEFPKSGRLLDTDVTWSDLTLDYLWWTDYAFDETCDEESVHGQKCLVLVLRKDARAVRVWVDRRTGALMQAEETRDGKAVRRLWGARLKKFGERWMANVMEVETIGSGHRTKITVEELQ